MKYDRDMVMDTVVNLFVAATLVVAIFVTVSIFALACRADDTPSRGDIMDAYILPLETTDDLLGIQLATGNDDFLLAPSMFRKRHEDILDLRFPIEVLRTPLILRVRARANLRRALALEFRY